MKGTLRSFLSEMSLVSVTNWTFRKNQLCVVLTEFKCVYTHLILFIICIIYYKVSVEGRQKMLFAIYLCLHVWLYRIISVVWLFVKQIKNIKLYKKSCMGAVITNQPLFTKREFICVENMSCDPWTSWCLKNYNSISKIYFY